MSASWMGQEINPVRSATGIINKTALYYFPFIFIHSKRGQCSERPDWLWGLSNGYWGRFPRG
jgi:hypothetical protein